jgi:hypothetical protein
MKVSFTTLYNLQEEAEALNSLKPKLEKDDPDGGDKIKTEVTEDLKHTEDSTALKNAILGPQPAESETPAPAESIPTVHSTKTETISSGQLLSVDYFF